MAVAGQQQQQQQRQIYSHPMPHTLEGLYEGHHRKIHYRKPEVRHHHNSHFFSTIPTVLVRA